MLALSGHRFCSLFEESHYAGNWEKFPKYNRLER